MEVVREMIGALGVCAGCGRRGTVLCDACRSGFGDPPWLPAGLGDAVVLGRYAGPLRRAVTALKFRGAVAVAAALARPIADAVRAHVAVAERFAVVPVPTSSSRARRRGYDQACLLAAAIAAELDVPSVHVLTRAATHGSQTDADRRTRLRPVPHRFLVRAAPPAMVLAVDDVITTGATLRSAVRVLRACGATVVPVAAAATRLRSVAGTP